MDTYHHLSRPVARQIMDGLQVHPEFWSCAKCLRKAPGGIGSDAAFAALNFIDALQWYAHMPGGYALRSFAAMAGQDI